MLNQNDIIEFFDHHSATWDEDLVHDDKKINTILDNAKVQEGNHILDVACGTGVLIPDYLTRKVSSVTAIDISPKMIELAKAKFPQSSVTFLCGDVQKADVGNQFDCIVVYNAFPHFPDPEGLIAHLSKLLKSGGRLTVAHGSSRETIDQHHKGFASKVSIGLMEVEKLAAIFQKYLDVTTIISDDHLYQVVGTKQK